LEEEKRSDDQHHGGGGRVVEKCAVRIVYYAASRLDIRVLRKERS
jgi:hypothetical protein